MERAIHEVLQLVGSQRWQPLADSLMLLNQQEIIIEVLLRLPVKSLLRFMSVCQQWYKIIKSQRFIHMHSLHNHATSLLVYFDGWLPGDINSSFVRGCSVFHTDATCEELHLLDPIRSMSGPFNGIFCVQRDRTLSLWNPATRGLRSVPRCPLHVTLEKYGFGIDPLTNSFKIVLIDMYHSQFSVYNSRSGSWQLHKDEIFYNSRSHVLLDNRGQPFSNGFCYWMLHHVPNRTSLLAFDMRNDSFQEIEMPAKIIKPDYKAKLDLYNGTLALLSYHSTDRCVETWLLKEQGCWEQLSRVHLSFRISEPIGILKGNKIYLCDAPHHLIIYDTDSGRKLNVEYNRVGHIFDMVAYPYKESLAPV